MPQPVWAELLHPGLDADLPDRPADTVGAQWLDRIDDRPEHLLALDPAAAAVEHVILQGVADLVGQWELIDTVALAPDA